MRKRLPSQAALRAALDYDQRTGVFLWRRRPEMHRRWNARYPGTVAGRKCKGYLEIMLDGVRYAAHRLAWVWVYGVDPGPMIDHKNTIRDDNGIINLRPADNRQNHQNSIGWKSRELPKGVYRSSNSNGFRAALANRRFPEVMDRRHAQTCKNPTTMRVCLSASAKKAPAHTGAPAQNSGL